MGPALYWVHGGECLKVVSPLYLTYGKGLQSLTSVLTPKGLCCGYVGSKPSNDINNVCLHTLCVSLSQSALSGIVHILSPSMENKEGICKAQRDKSLMVEC